MPPATYYAQYWRLETRQESRKAIAGGHAGARFEGKRNESVAVADVAMVIGVTSLALLAQESKTKPKTKAHARAHVHAHGQAPALSTRGLSLATLPFSSEMAIANVCLAVLAGPKGLRFRFLQNWPRNKQTNKLSRTCPRTDRHGGASIQRAPPTACTGGLYDAPPTLQAAGISIVKEVQAQF